MSLLNIGLQCVGLMRAKVSDGFESAIQNCNNLQQLRQAANLKKEEISSSLKPAVDLLHDLFKHLELKGQPFETYKAADEDDIKEFWEVLLLIDATLTMEDTTKKLIKKIQVYHLLEHCTCVTDLTVIDQFWTL